MSTLASQQPPAVTIAQNSFSTHSSHGSIGPLIAVLVVIVVLGLVSVLVGRLCSGRRIFGYGQFDIERWAEAHCSSCIDGRISPPPLRPNPVPNSVFQSMATQSSQETKNEEEEEEEEEEEDHSSQHNHGRV